MPRPVVALAPAISSRSHAPPSPFDTIHCGVKGMNIGRSHGYFTPLDNV